MIHTFRFVGIKGIFISLCLGLLSVTSLAQDASAIFKSMDKNGDGQISREEWLRPPKAFDLVDANQDGFISPEEMQARTQGHALKPQATGLSPIDLKELYFVDAHGQVDNRTDEKAILELMDRGGVYRSIVTAQQGRDWTDVAAMADKHPGRLIAAAYTKGGGYHGGGGAASEFLARLDKQAEQNSIRAIAELLVVHDGLGGRFYEVKVPLEDRLVQAGISLAEKKGWPVLLHIEFNSLKQQEQNDYMQQLRSLLNKYPKQSFVLMHMGLLEALQVKALLDELPNLHFLTSHTTPNHSGNGEKDKPKPKIALFAASGLRPQWRSLFTQYPTRFVFALDNVSSIWWQEKPYTSQMRHWWNAMGGLPSNVAHAIAHGNAERLWRLAPKADGGMKPAF